MIGSAAGEVRAAWRSQKEVGAACAIAASGDAGGRRKAVTACPEPPDYFFSRPGIRPEARGRKPEALQFHINVPGGSEGGPVAEGRRRRGNAGEEEASKRKPVH